METVEVPGATQAKTNGGHAAGMPQVEVEAPAPKNARRPFAILGIVALVFLVGIGGYLLLTAGEVDTDDAQVAADVVPIGTRVAGQVVKVAIVENQRVKKGDLLVQIDDADYQAKLEEAQAGEGIAEAQAQAADAQVLVVQATSKGGLASARAMYSGSSVGVSTAAAQASLERAQAEARKADNDLRRAKELRAENAVTEERLDNAKVAYDAAQAALAQAKAQVAVAEEARRGARAMVSEAQGRLTQSAPIDSKIAAARAQADLAHARVKSAQAAVELARLQLSYTKILAPADGLASKLTVHEGQLVGVGQPVIQLVPIETYLVANFKETQIGKMRPGQPAEIEVDALPGKKFEGKVESLSGGTGASFSLLPADNATGNYVKVVQRVPVRIGWVHPPTEMILRAGLSATVTVKVGG